MNKITKLLKKKESEILEFDTFDEKYNQNYHYGVNKILFLKRIYNKFIISNSPLEYILKFNRDVITDFFCIYCLDKDVQLYLKNIISLMNQDDVICLLKKHIDVSILVKCKENVDFSGVYSNGKTCLFQINSLNYLISLLLSDIDFNINYKCNDLTFFSKMISDKKNIPLNKLSKLLWILEMRDYNFNDVFNYNQF